MSYEMSFSLDEAPIEMECPECGRAVRTKIRTGRQSRKANEWPQFLSSVKIEGLRGQAAT